MEQQSIDALLESLGDANVQSSDFESILANEDDMALHSESEHNSLRLEPVSALDRLEITGRVMEDPAVGLHRFRLIAHRRALSSNITEIDTEHQMNLDSHPEVQRSPSPYPFPARDNDMLINEATPFDGEARTFADASTQVVQNSPLFPINSTPYVGSTSIAVQSGLPAGIRDSLPDQTIYRIIREILDNNSQDMVLGLDVDIEERLENDLQDPGLDNDTDTEGPNLSRVHLNPYMRHIGPLETSRIIRSLRDDPNDGYPAVNPFNHYAAEISMTLEDVGSMVREMWDLAGQSERRRLGIELDLDSDIVASLEVVEGIDPEVE